MSRKLEDLFNLPHTSTNEEEGIESVLPNISELKETDNILDRIDQALPSIKDLTASDEEMDHLAKLSTDAFENLIDLGMSVDPRFGGQIMQTAAQMMTNAINAKNAKIEKKLRMVELQLRKASLDQKERMLEAKLNEKKDDEPSEQGNGIVMDRNALLKEILNNGLKKD